MCLLTVSVTVRVALIVDFLGGSEVQNLTANTGDVGSIPGSRRSPGEGNGKPLTWRIPWTGEPSGLQSMGSQRVGHDLTTKPQPQQY